MAYPQWQMSNSRVGWNMEKDEINDWIIEFYKRQYLEFTRLGVGRRTREDVLITGKLIRCTANRLDQLIKGKKTPDNMSEAEKLFNKYGRTIELMEKAVWIEEKALHNSNRSFIGHISHTFNIKDLEMAQEEEVCNYIDYADGSPYDEPRYIDKYTTAYNSDIMVAILSHDN